MWCTKGFAILIFGSCVGITMYPIYLFLYELQQSPSIIGEYHFGWSTIPIFYIYDYPKTAVNAYIFWPALMVTWWSERKFSISGLEPCLSQWSPTLILWLQYAYMIAEGAGNFKMIFIVTTFPDLQVSTWILNCPLPGKFLCTVCLATNVTCSQIS